MKKVIVAMSGGVDSTVTVALLKEAGYEVVGATMFLGNESVIEKAKKCAAELGIEHHVVDLCDKFKCHVVDNFVSEYVAGRTPNPCVACNRNIKMGAFFEACEEFGFDYFATGHYAQVVEVDGRFALKQSTNLKKDQTYFLYPVTQKVLSRLILPLGKLEKTEVRRIAAEHGLSVATTKDSQDICFVPDGDYRKILAENGVENVAGNFVNKHGDILGKHNGVCNYTLGQRKGLGVALGYPVFVTALRPETNEVVLGFEEDLMVDVAYTKDNNFQLIDGLHEPREVQVRVRYSPRSVAATILPAENGLVEIRFAEPEKSVKAGQAAVFYDGDVVVGGGTII